jgi:hypothetical protein
LPVSNNMPNWADFFLDIEAEYALIGNIFNRGPGKIMAAA